VARDIYADFNASDPMVREACEAQRVAAVR
jgi:hypothetical protein